MRNEKLLISNLKQIREIVKDNENDLNDIPYLPFIDAIDKTIQIAERKKDSSTGSYLLAYTIVPFRGGEMKDYFEVYCDYPNNEKAAQERMDTLIKKYEKNPKKELYCWNICKITKTSEHYTIKKP